MEEPRPAMISTRPPLTMEAVAICWYSRIGSSVDSTLTAVDSVIVAVTAAAALITADGEDTGIEAVWCSPTP